MGWPTAASLCLVSQAVWSEFCFLDMFLFIGLYKRAEALNYDILSTQKRSVCSCYCLLLLWQDVLAAGCMSILRQRWNIWVYLWCCVIVSFLNVAPLMKHLKSGLQIYHLTPTDHEPLLGLFFFVIAVKPTSSTQDVYRWLCTKGLFNSQKALSLHFTSRNCYCTRGNGFTHQKYTGIPFTRGLNSMRSEGGSSRILQSGNFKVLKYFLYTWS